MVIAHYAGKGRVKQVEVRVRQEARAVLGSAGSCESAERISDRGELGGLLYRVVANPAACRRARVPAAEIVAIP